MSDDHADLPLTDAQIAEARERVRRGITVLDQAWPGWRRELDGDLLKMESGGFNPDFPGGPMCGCVLAQYDYRQTRADDHRAGFFLEGVEALAGPHLSSGELHWWAFHHGFQASPDLETDSTAADVEYELLERLWLEELTEVPA